jgi:hypothetical protein
LDAVLDEDAGKIVETDDAGNLQARRPRDPTELAMRKFILPYHWMEMAVQLLEVFVPSLPRSVHMLL